MMGTVDVRSNRGGHPDSVREGASRASVSIQRMASTGLISRLLFQLLIIFSLVMTASIACDAVEERISPSTPSPAPTATQVPTATPDPATATPAGGTPPTAPTTAAGLVLPVAIAVAPPNIPKYDRGEWRHWSDEDGDCQNARQEVLIAESTVAVSFQTGDRCRVASGSWIGPYTGEGVNDPGDLDVDHVVPLANAHRSGAWTWDRDRKRDYANSLAYDNHLMATTSSANRSKGAKGPEEWRPPLEGYWCTYAVDWATIKNQWGLTVTEAEYAALSEMLATCEAAVLLQPTRGAAPRPPTSTVPSDLPKDLRYDPFGPDRDCGDFDSYEEALAFYLAAGGPEADPHRLDSNQDGEPCETLPGGPSAQTVPVEPHSAGVLYTWAAAPDTEGPLDCAATGPPRGASGYLPPRLVGGSADSGCPPAMFQGPPEPAPPSTVVPGPAISPVPVPDTEANDHPIPAPQQSPPPEQPLTDRDCEDFSDRQEAQAFYVAEGGPEDDPHGLDRDGDGVACQSLPGSPGNPLEPTASGPAPTSRSDDAGSVVTAVLAVFVDMPFDPVGPDRDCDDFSTWWDAQNFYLAAGGPRHDPHRLDHIGEGVACQSLPGAPQIAPVASTSEAGAQSEVAFVDFNCSDFTTWREAQDFYVAEGGPSEDPHQLDRDGDGTACQSLPGAPGDDPEPPTAKAGTSTPGNGFVDRNCSDFTTWREAQDFYEAEGGPGEDPHGLDRDSDGTACQSLPGAPGDDPIPPATGTAPTAEATTFIDRNCSDFATWPEAQDFYVSEGGPGEDPHGLDRDSDGTACQSLPGAPDKSQDAPTSTSDSSSPAGEFVDRNCSDFTTWREAQDFYEAEGGPGEDPHGLDRDSDGVACQSLPGAPDDDT